MAALRRYAVEQRVGCAEDLKSFVGRDGEYAFSCAEEKDVKNPVTKEVVPFTIFKFEQDFVGKPSHQDESYNDLDGMGYLPHPVR